MIFKIFFLLSVCVSPFFCGCVDQLGYPKSDGDFWQEDCNVCKCLSGHKQCTLENCDQIGGTKPCICINPFENIENYYSTGDPDVTCKTNRRFCYVDCKANCYDIQIARGAGRCTSSAQACDNRYPPIGPSNTNNGPGPQTNNGPGPNDGADPYNPCSPGYVACECLNREDLSNNENKACNDFNDPRCIVDIKADCADKECKSNRETNYGVCFSRRACFPTAFQCSSSFK